MTRFRVIDLETTGTAPPAEVIEFGRVDVLKTDSGFVVERPASRLYRPVRGIPPETMAVHHLTPSDFSADMPTCGAEELRSAVWSGAAPDVLVAHSCEFERQFVTGATTASLPWICTYKVALRVWPEAPRHSNQVLRYWRGLQLDPTLAMPPHRAGPDAWVTAHLLVELAERASLDQMITWTSEPKLMPVIPFGKHRGAKWADAPLDYLQWMQRQTGMDADAIWNAAREIRRRAEASG
jgi:exodeoxyribonuclease X